MLFRMLISELIRRFEQSSEGCSKTNPESQEHCWRHESYNV